MLVNFFATLSLFFGFVAISSFSAHNSVYFMIITFLLTGIFYYLISSTYVSMMLFIVYVGAVAILFVFCVMLLNLQSEGFVARLQYFFYSVIVFFTTFVFIFFLSFFYSVDLSYYPISPYFDISLNFFTKDVTFLSSFYSFYTFYIFFLGVLLFFVTVAATILLGLFYLRVLNVFLRFYHWIFLFFYLLFVYCSFFGAIGILDNVFC